MTSRWPRTRSTIAGVPSVELSQTEDLDAVGRVVLGQELHEGLLDHVGPVVGRQDDRERRQVVLSADQAARAALRGIT